MKASSPIRSQHVVPTGTPPTRLSDYIRVAFPDFPSRKSAIKAIKRGEIYIDNTEAQTGTWVQEGQLIILYEQIMPMPKVFPLKLEVLYDDPFLAIVNKPGGLLTSGNTYKSLENALAYNLSPSPEQDALAWPRPTHRLDQPTSGLVIIAKTQYARIQLGSQFEKRQIKKTYEALAIGAVPDSGKWEIPVDQKEAHTAFTCIRRVPALKGNWLSHVRLFPTTGRRHQLRQHLSSAGFPILGDKLYGIQGLILYGKGLFLCATQLTFPHPITEKPLAIEVPPPHKFEIYLNRAQSRWEKFKGQNPP